MEYTRAEITMRPGGPAPALLTVLAACPFVEDFQDGVVGGRRQVVVQFNAPIIFYDAFISQCREMGVEIVDNFPCF